MALPRTLLGDIPPKDANLKVMRGRMPHDLGGAYFLNSPDPRDGGPHGFYGSGVLYRISLEPGQFGAGPDEYALRHAMVSTPGYRFRKRMPDAVVPTAAGNAARIGPINCPNTGHVPWGDRLLVTWDGGRPVEVCPSTMEFLGELGRRDEWDDTFGGLTVFPSIISPAHAVVDPELGCFFSCCYRMFAAQTSLVISEPGSTQVRRWPLEGVQTDSVIHTMAVTRHWVILGLSGMRIDARELYGLERKVTGPRESVLHLVRKEDLLSKPPGTVLAVKTVRIAPESMHFYAQYDDTDGIRLMVEHSTDSDIAMAIRPGDVDIYGEPIDPRIKGMYGLALSPPEVSMVEIDADRATARRVSTYSDPTRMWNVQTSGQDWSRAGLVNPTLHHTLYNGFRREGISERQFELYEDRVDTRKIPPDDQPACLLSFDWNNGGRPRASYQWPDDAWATSPAFAARRAKAADGGDGEGGYAGGEPGGHDGYVLVSVLRDRGYELDIFDAADVSKGPVATLAAQGHVVPFVIHANWMPNVVPAQSLEHVRFGDEVSERMLKKVPRRYAHAIREIRDELEAERIAREARRRAPA